ncbi:glycosyl hydrolase family 18 protein [Oerskovia sp. Root918]|uniref:glycosyl hydrolase family 18 protein n=1 Tax=Oerskovia sp. Root918 TaxID=1736607 RepID=UPI000A883008|nr:glycosyl hydrolase family 18 protein [Oerskovia sp. Root918]
MRTLRHPADGTRRPARLLAALTAATVALGGLALAGTSAQAAPLPAAQPATVAAAAAPGHQWLTGYWHNFNNGSVVMPLSDIPAAYNLVAVAFADNLTGTPGGITFNLSSAELNGYTVPQFKADIAAIRAQGRKVILSVGGEKGNVIVSNATEAKNFADTAYGLMQEYGFDGVDIDLEHGINATYMSSALHQLSAKAGPNLIIAMAPQTIDYQATSMGYYQLTLAIKDILTIVNTQYYNSGAMMGCNQQVYSQGSIDFLTSLSCIQLEMGLRPDQVGIGVPAVQAAAGGGYQPIANVIKAVDCLETGTGCGTFKPATPYGKIGGVMTWSINWDKKNNYALATAVGARLGTGSGGGGTDPTGGSTGGDPTGGGTDPTGGSTGGDPTGGSTGGDPTGGNTGGTDPTGGTTGGSTGGSGTCSAAAWDASSIYTGGNTVAHNGHTWQAKWWTRGDAPAPSDWGVWKDLGAC